MGNIEGIMFNAELQKDKSLLYNQIFTQLWEYTGQNLQKGLSSSTIASNFHNNPNVVISSMRRKARNNNKFSHEIFMKDIYEIAKESSFTATQMGRTFGAVPDVFGMSATTKGFAEQFGINLTPMEAKRIKERVAFGIGQFSVEDVKILVLVGLQV